VPVSNAEAIVEKLLQLDRDRDLLLAMSIAAAARAGYFSMESYTHRLQSALSME
jgi:hypothetical protein